MEGIVFDDCLQALYEAQVSLNDYVELTSYQMLFEAAKPEVAKAEANNAEVKEKTDNALIRAIKAVGAMITKIVNSIKDFIARITMKKDEKNAFHNFELACKNDPSLATKKVTVKDWRKITTEMSALEKEMEAAIKSDKEDEDRDKNLILKAEKFLAGNIGAASTEMSAEAAKRFALDNVRNAKLISIILNNSNEVMKTLETNMGEKEAQKYKKNMNKYGRKISLTRMLAKLTNQHYECLSDNVISVGNDLMGLVHGKPSMGAVNVGKRLLNNPTTGKTIKDVTKTAASAGVFAGKEYVGEIHDLNKKERKNKIKEKFGSKRHEKGTIERIVSPHSEVHFDPSGNRGK